ncbi:MAG TPA: hypothetical protein VK904_03580 [Miltoncostaeaceae bacterium]|nr:hypothetical protein [Miltoncostaeaceae bacterium]
MEPGVHADLMAEGIRADGEAFRAMFDGRPRDATALLREAARRFRASWEAAPPRSYGRLVAYLASSVLAGDGPEAAAYARAQLEGACDSPTSCYALAVAALVEGDDAAAAAAAEAMRKGGDAFARAADALAALAARDRARYGEAVAAIVADFEARDAHRTGVPVADTALLMEALAGARGMAARPRSPVMPEAAPTA